MKAIVLAGGEGTRERAAAGVARCQPFRAVLIDSLRGVAGRPSSA